MVLDIFDSVVPEDKLHDKFKLIRDQLYSEKEILTEWTEGFIDRDNKIVKEFQTSFHSALWEFYLHKIFSGLGMKINYGHDRPDFMIEEPSPFLVEATVAEIKKGGRPEKERGLDDAINTEQLVHLREDFDKVITEAIIRNSNGVNSKCKKYNDAYSKLEWVGESTPYVIALSSYDQIDYGYEFIYAMLPLLYGQRFDIDTFSSSPMDSVIKPETGSSIPLNLFEKDEYKHVSAVIFSCTVTLGKLTSLAISKGLPTVNSVHLIRHDMDYPHFKVQKISSDNPEEIEDGLCIFYNPNAQNPLPREIFKDTSILQYDGASFYSEQCPLYARYNRMQGLDKLLQFTLFPSVNRANGL